ncbi:sporulation membrane protein YtrI [Bacillus xiapuensis]|uniref:sporulation membrane protein YtrI n=1 Tax=Bacillus xiapuensis TaxID=2014075 RepID=UPI000C24241A|nr:sporulation membrane protein YtrI [Bacillus xiapuensis]
MRVPDLHKHPKRKWLLSGAAIGFCLSWLVFLYVYGTLQERQSTIMEIQKNEIRDLRNHLAIWQEEYKELNKQNLHKLTVQEIEITITNYEKYGIEDAQSLFEAKELVKKDLSVLLAKDLDTVYSHKELLRQTIENKTLKINKKHYSLHIKEWLFYTTIQIELELELQGD